MKAATAEDIFGTADLPYKVDTLWAPDTEAPSPSNKASDMAAFEATERPLEKSRKEVHDEGIDRTPILSVAEIRAKFNQASAEAKFPKKATTAVAYTDRLKTQSLQETKKEGFSTCNSTQPSSLPSPHTSSYVDVFSDEMSNEKEETTLNEKHDATLSQSCSLGYSNAEIADENPNYGRAKNEASETSARVSPREMMTTEEFSTLAQLNGCEDALERFRDPVPMFIVIRPDVTLWPAGEQNNVPNVVIKPMCLQFNPEQRMLMMVRDNTLRYVRLNDIVKMDSREVCLDEMKAAVCRLDNKFNQPIALHFTTAKNPMVIVLSDKEQKQALVNLLLLLRKLVKTSNPFQYIT